MRVVLASAEYPPQVSGFALIAWSLCREYGRIGIDVTILTHGEGCKRIGKRVAAITPRGRDLIRSGADIVHIIGPTPLFTEQVARAGVRAGVPVVYTASDFGGMRADGGNPFYGVIDRTYQELVYYRVLRAASAVVFQTRDFAECFPVKGLKTGVIPFGVRPIFLHAPETQSENGPPPSDRHHLLYVGQLRRYKGIAYLVEALGQLIAEDGHVWDLTVVGGGALAESLAELVRRLGLSQDVRFTGPVADAAQLLEIYRSHDVLVVSSERGESFNMSQVEARLAGLQVVVTDQPGSREVCRELGGVVVQSRSPRAIAEGIRSAVRNRSVRGPEHGTVSRERFDWAHIAQSYVDLFHRLLEARSPGRSQTPTGDSR